MDRGKHVAWSPDRRAAHIIVITRCHLSGRLGGSASLSGNSDRHSSASGRVPCTHTSIYYNTILYEPRATSRPLSASRTIP